MEMIIQILLGGFIASILWFFIGGVLYRNPFIAKIYKDLEDSEGLKKWEDMKKYMITMYVFGILIQCIFFAFVYAFIKPVLPGDIILNSLYFFLILILVKIVPRLFDMWIQSTYPNKLLAIEFINGTIGCLIISITLALIIF